MAKAKLKVITKPAEEIEKCLTGSFALCNEEHAYFIGTLAECAAFAKGYNDRASVDDEESSFEIFPAAFVKLRKETN